MMSKNRRIKGVMTLKKKCKVSRVSLKVKHQDNALPGEIKEWKSMEDQATDIQKNKSAEYCNKQDPPDSVIEARQEKFDPNQRWQSKFKSGLKGKVNSTDENQANQDIDSKFNESLPRNWQDRILVKSAINEISNTLRKIFTRQNIVAVVKKSVKESVEDALEKYVKNDFQSYIQQRAEIRQCLIDNSILRLLNACASVKSDSGQLPTAELNCDKSVNTNHSNDLKAISTEIYLPQSEKPSKEIKPSLKNVYNEKPEQKRESEKLILVQNKLRRKLSKVGKTKQGNSKVLRFKPLETTAQKASKTFTETDERSQRLEKTFFRAFNRAGNSRKRLIVSRIKNNEPKSNEKRKRFQNATNDQTRKIRAP